ncbi:MAG: DNA phosphorothioation system sulfurtransferase DndC [Caldilineaceae bacterium]|nr:DNA phosphorothioation system sulfurtransferase DndC [Caldilineaceae bacterium]
MTDSVPSDPPGLADRFEEICQAIKKEYCKRHSDPWIVAYSGGKDSTLLLQLVWETLLSLAPEKRRREVHVIANDTLVESPIVIQHLKNSLQEIKLAAASEQLPISIGISQPYIDQTFWVNVIGRGYIPPTRNFRWCTDRMKIQPTNRLIEAILSQHKRAVLLVGTRRSESQTRRRNMDRHGVSASKLNPHSSIKNCRMFAPLADLEDNEVWVILMQRRPPWGNSHRQLITIYRNAGGGECPLVLTKEDAPSCGTTSPRFGCWTCTVVKKDRSMNGTIESGHAEQDKLEALLEFREELINLRENNENRSPVRRDGLTKRRDDGTRVYGPFTLEVRKQIRDRLKALEARTGERIISQPELEIIEDIWRHDRIQEDGRMSLIEKLDGETA